MNTRIALHNFTGGELSEWPLSARYDLAKYKTGCKKQRNFICELHGDLRRRPGTFFCEDLGGPAALVPFQFSTDYNQNYCLVFQAGKIRIAQNYGFVLDGSGNPVQITTPYAEADLENIYYGQSGDIMYLAHRSYPFKKLVRSSHTSWALSDVAFTPSIGQVTGITVAFHNASGTADYTLRYVVCAENSKGEISLQSTPGSTATGKYPTDWVVGDYCTVSWTAVTGAERYYIYRESGGYYGLIGVAEGQSTVTFRDENYEADTANTPPLSNDFFGSNNYPGLVAFHEQRLILGSAAKEPQTFYGSKTGSFEDWSKSRPLKEDDAIKFTVASGSIDKLQWIVSFRALLLGTGGVEYQVSGDNNGAITPTKVSIKAQSYWGSAPLRPLIIGTSVLHVQRQGSHVRDMFFDLQQDGYNGNDLSVLAPHLFDGYSLTRWAYQQAPGCVVWAVRNDGALLGLSYLKAHQIYGWGVHETQGEFKSICTTSGDLEDVVWLVVKRTIGGVDKYFLERMATKWKAADGIAEAMFLDSAQTYRGAATSTVSGLGHLEGCTVDALVDGSPVRGLTVSGGGVTLPMPGSVVHVGLPYQSLMIPMTPEADTQDGTTLGKQKSYGRCVARLVESVGGQYGPDEDNLTDFPFTPDFWGTAVQPFSGDREFALAAGYSSTESICIAQNLPLPFTLNSLALEVNIEG